VRSSRGVTVSQVGRAASVACGLATVFACSFPDLRYEDADGGTADAMDAMDATNAMDAASDASDANAGSDDRGPFVDAGIDATDDEASRPFPDASATDDAIGNASADGGEGASRSDGNDALAMDASADGEGGGDDATPDASGDGSGDADGGGGGDGAGDASGGDAAGGDATSDGAPTDGAGSDGASTEAGADASTCDEDGDHDPATGPVCGGDDCDDHDARAFFAEPDFLTFTPTATTQGDWNCNGSLEKQYAVNVSCGLLNLGQCNTTSGLTGDPACGTSGPFVQCQSNGLLCSAISTTTKTQGCK
jgi:hypothetical protein